ncbi:transketolase [Candidatus Sumerlaeota bacterium]|nr:transketolase [Candidatus Sumerlaeota bacterium]
MKDTEKQMLAEVAKAIRGLSLDGVETAKCGHPGLPLGCAEIGAYLYGSEMRHNPADPNWLGRDRFILSAGHGSMLLYSCLHLSGYDLPLEELKHFRQLHSKTPGHPEYGITPGVETTTGPLGQGMATATGMALGNKMMAAQLGVENEGFLDGQIFALVGDGCMMEGITNEAASLAGHLKLDNLIVIYDSNDICLDGPTKECFTEDTAMRYKAYGWHVVKIDGHDFDQIEKAVRAARRRKDKPTLIVAKTIIGKGAPHIQGTAEVHGKAMGAEEAKLTKQAHGIPLEPAFYVSDAVREYMKSRLPRLKRMESTWNRKFKKWSVENPEKAIRWRAHVEKTLSADLDEKILNLEIKPGVAGRVASNAILGLLCKEVPYVVGGSADLSCSDSTMMKGSGIIGPGDLTQRNIKYGVREFAMCAMNSGLALQGMILPYCGTFLTFSDYMRNALRLASMMGVKVVYQFTHDCFHMGEDGPTHIPVEQVASLRAMPGMTVMRPADTNEVRRAWCLTLRMRTPVALILSRQNTTDLAETAVPIEEGVARGTYVVKKESRDEIDYCLLAAGVEVALALGVAKRLEEQGKSVRVVSMPSFELFDAQDKNYRDATLALDKKVGQYWSLEALTSFGWHKYVGRDGHCVSIEDFAVSAPWKVQDEYYGFTVDKVLDRMAREG